MLQLPDIVYAQRNDLPLHLALYLPDHASSALPVVVWFIGGGWWKCDHHAADQTWLVEAGFAVASVQYRVSAQAAAPANIHDGKAAVHYLRTHAAELNLDAERIGVCGSSAGGQLALLVALTEGVAALDGAGDAPALNSAVRAAVSFAGPTDLVALTAVREKIERPERFANRERYLGGPAEQRQDLARLVSPVTYASADRVPLLPPVLLLHGLDDPIVPVDQARRLHEALQRAGAAVAMELLPGVGHSARSSPRAQSAAVEFLCRTL